MNIVTVMVGKKLRYISRLEQDIISLVNKETCIRAGVILDNFFTQVPVSGITSLLNSLVKRGFIIKKRVNKESLNNYYDDFYYVLPEIIQTLVKSNFRKC